MFRLFATTSAFALLATAAGGAQAQETAQLEEVVVVGSRATARLVTDSPAPVDVISAETLAAQGFDDISRALAFIAPSFNFPRGATGPDVAHVPVPAAPETPAPRLTFEVIATDPGILERYAVKPGRRTQVITDETLLTELAMIDRPTGLVRAGGRVWLTNDVVNQRMP